MSRKGIALFLSQCLLAVLVAVCGCTSLINGSHALTKQAGELALWYAENQKAADAAGGEEESSEAADPEESIATAKSDAKGLKDGKYYGTGQGYGGPVTVKLVVKNGRIKSLTVTEAPGEGDAYLNLAERILPVIKKKGSANVDGISGATLSSNGIKAAAGQALKKAGGSGKVAIQKAAVTAKSSGKPSKKAKYKKPKGGWKDGVYKGSAKGFGGTVSVKVTIKKGKITKITASGEGETSSYWKKAQKVKKRIISKQSPKVDSVSGATYSSRGIINAVIKALNKASKGSGRKDQTIETAEESYVLWVGNPAISISAKAKTALTYQSADPAIAKVSKDGKIMAVSAGNTTITITAAKSKKYKKAVKKVKVTVYPGYDEEEPAEPVPTDPDTPEEPDNPDEPVNPDEPDPDKINGTFNGSAQGYGGLVTAVVEIKNSKISSIDVEGKGESGQYWFMAKKIVPKMISRQTWDIDAISGATYSSNAIRNAVKQALQSAGLI